MPLKHFVALAALFIFLRFQTLADSNHQAKSGRQTTKSLCSLGNNSQDLEFASWGSAADLVRTPKDLSFTKWTNWSPCSRSCVTKRHRKCKVPARCKKKVEQEEAFCYSKDTSCFKWIYDKVCSTDPDDQEYEYQEYYDYELSDNDSYEDFDSSVEIKEPTCGAPKAMASALTRIIGGRPSKKGQWPWQVAILNRNKHPFCGGTLIDHRWVLTAAHCVRKTLFVRLGEHNLNKDDGNELEVKVTKSIAHPNYDTDTVDSDLALLRLQSSPGGHNLACLPQPGQQPPRNQLCTIIGWGKRKASDLEGTHVLHQTEVFVMPDEKCREMYESYYISENMFCAGHSSRRDSCAGDSGGPLLCRVEDRWTIFGVTSFGEGCGKKGKFGVYTLVPNYIHWIRKTING